MSTESGIETTDLTEIVGEHDIVCDFAEAWSCPKEHAAWIMHCVPCACGAGGVRLSCTPCKDLRISSEGGVVCDCGVVTVPAREAYYLIEALK